MNRTQIIIVRHGQTEWNIRGIRQGYLDSPLTGRGMAQAKALAQRLAREKFTALYSSDLGRAVQTAQEIANVTGHAIVTDARLRERHLGIFQGLNAEEINAKYLDRTAGDAQPGAWICHSRRRKHGPAGRAQYGLPQRVSRQA